jgi:hypothetical protein
MANFIVGFSVLDADGDSSDVSIHFSGADLAAAQAFATGVVQAADTLIGGQVTEVRITQSMALPGGIKGAPVANSDNEVKGRFIYQSAAGFKSRVSLPSFLKDTYTVVGGAIDTADPDVFAFNDTAMIGGGATTSHYEDLTALVSAREAFGRG